MRRRWLFTSLATLAFAALLYGALDELRPQRRYNVILLTMESARAEIMSPDIMPNVWRVAGEGIRFTQHRAVSAWTGTNAVSLLTGLSPFTHGIHSRDQPLPADWALPLKDLAAAGWRIAGLQSFMMIDAFQDVGLNIELASLHGWLATQARARQPFALWYHYLDTHLPYAPPAPFRPDLSGLDADQAARIGKVMTMPAIPAGEVDFQSGDRDAIRALYLANFRAFDAWFLEFWQFLVRSGLRDNTLVILTTDHGEELLERGNVGHASTSRAGHLHEEIVRLPLVVWLPKALKPSPAVVSTITEHTDVMPTIFDVLQRSPTRPMSGASLLEVPPRRTWLAATSGAGFAEADPFHIQRFVFSALDWPWKLHLVRVDGTERSAELYNLDDDPGERVDLARQHPDIADRLRAQLLPQIAAMRIATRPGPGNAAIAETPQWIFPPADGTYRYDDLAGRFQLRWTGSAQQNYRVQYQAGTAPLTLRGELDIGGTIRDFGEIDRAYWNKWIVPYRTFRLRVGIAGRDDRWSEWREITVAP